MRIHPADSSEIREPGNVSIGILDWKERDIMLVIP